MSFDDKQWPPGVDVSKLTDAVSITAGRVYGKYRRRLKSADELDVQQELWIFAWKKREKIREYLDREDRAGQKKGWSALLTTLHRAGERYCVRQAAHDSGYEVQDLKWYTVDQIKDWIAVLVNGDGVMSNQVGEADVKAPRMPSEGWNLEASIADIQRAMKVLDSEDMWMLLEHYGHLTNRSKIAEVLDVSESTVQRRIDDALKKMLERLGGPRPW